jgi:hypothetical protein
MKTFLELVLAGEVQREDIRGLHRPLARRRDSLFLGRIPSVVCRTLNMRSGLSIRRP